LAAVIAIIRASFSAAVRWAGMIETMAIYCLVIALLVLFANPFIR
jgi:F0F1-type ATP synthase membrane subunit c/vacuolar-type H+-ATPase subunit K